MSNFIREIKIKNFQNHKDSTLNLVPGINTITGSSGNGKSVIIKSIKWAVKNRPGGTSFIKHGEKEASIKLSFDDFSVTRKRGKKNQYIVQQKNGEQSHSALGSKIPEEVTSLLNLQDVNIQSQFDTFFLLQESPGNVAKALNKTVGVDIIDRVRSICNDMISETKLRKVRQKNLLTDKQEALEEYTSLPRLKELSKSLLSMDKQLKIAQNDKSGIVSKLKTLRKIADKLKSYSYITFLEKKVVILKEHDKLLRKAGNKLFLINGIIKEYNEIRLKLLHQPVLPPKELLNSIKIKIGKVKETEITKNTLTRHMVNIKELLSKESAADRSIDLLEGRLQKLRSSISFCPIKQIKCPVESVQNFKGA